MKPASATAASLLAIRPEGGAGAILADPPWHFRTFSDKGQSKSPSRHYSTLTPDEIAALPVGDVAARDAWLFLWVPTANLLQGLNVVNGWGFTFVGRAFVWLKQTKTGDLCVGLGKTTRKGGVEDCWLARRGRPHISAHDVRELIVSERREHSRKPDEVYPRIERLVAGPYLEMFARQQRPGWIAWGDQISKFDQPCTERVTHMGTKSRNEIEAKKLFQNAVRAGQPDLFADSYDAEADISESVKLGLKIIRQRMADGGPGWGKS